MPTLAPPEASLALRQAQANWSGNLKALRNNQPDAADLLEQVELNLEWILARDGSLTAMTSDGKWWGGCSVPLLAGQSVLKSLESGHAASCLLAPAHAGLVRAARQRMGDAPALFLVQPDAEIARVILCCHDFSAQILRHRFWVCCGADWSQQLMHLLKNFPGLATPARFIRTKWTSDEIVLPMITTAQEVFSAVLSDRAAELSSRQSNPRISHNRRHILIVGPDDFRLWDDAAHTLADQLGLRQSADGLTLKRFDTDDALNGSPLALLDAAGECGVIVSANLCRMDCNQLISPEIPWMTWITLAAVPEYQTAGPQDALVLADPNWRPLAHKAGWPADRVKIGGWPVREDSVTVRPVHPELAMICDTRSIEIPATVKGYSSHRLLWELIEQELHANPLVVEKVDEYLADRAGQLNIAPDALDRRSFIDGLIVPAYQQGLARLLMAEKLPLRLYGKGWSELSEFDSVDCPVLSSREQLQAAIQNATALVYCWPQRFAHPIESTGKPIVHRSGQDRNQLIRNARMAFRDLTDKPTGYPPVGQVIIALPHREVFLR